MTTIIIDGAGRVVIPKPLRDDLRIGPGDSLELQAEGESFTLRPIRSKTALRKKKGVWVFRSGVGISADQSAEQIRQVRGERDKQNASGLA